MNIKKNLKKEKTSELFLIALLLISMLVLVDIELAGLKLSVFLLFLLLLLAICYRMITIPKVSAIYPQMRYLSDVVILVLFGWGILSMIGSLFQDKTKGVIGYRLQITLIILSFLYFIFKEIKVFKDWYFDLILYSGLIVMGFMLFCYFGGMEMAGILSEVMNDSGKAASYLVLPCVISICRYCACRDKIRSYVYLMTAAIGYFTLLINHNIASLWMMTFIFLIIPVLLRPTAEVVKRDMQLFFIFFFMMSNMSLLTNYTRLIQKEVSYNLEHSVYLDLLLAIVGVVFFTYWDRIPEDADRERLVLKRMGRGYLFTLKLMGIVFLSFVLGGDMWKELPDTMGASMVKSFAVPLIDEIGSSKSAWVLCMENSGISTLLLLVFAVFIIKNLRKNYSLEKPLTSSFLLITILFLVQMFFYTPSVNTLPVYLLMLIMAAFYKEEKQQVVVSTINFQKEIMKNDEKSNESN